MVLTLVLVGGRALKGSGALSRKASRASLLLFSAMPLAASAGGSSACASSSAGQHPLHSVKLLVSCH